jgi:DNA-binding response OmpR family regulator
MEPSAESGRGEPATILVVDGDTALSYLLERYAERGGFRYSEVHVPWQASLLPDAGPAALWLPSIERLEAMNPRQSGIGDELPVIVCSFNGDEARARELGADYCAFHPVRYRDFLAALKAVGIAARGAVPERSPTG